MSKPSWIYVDRKTLEANNRLPEGRRGDPPILIRNPDDSRERSHETVAHCTCGKEAFRIVYRKKQKDSVDQEALVWVETHLPLKHLT